VNTVPEAKVLKTLIPGGLLLVQEDVDELLDLALFEADRLDGGDDGVGVGQLAGRRSRSRLGRRAVALLLGGFGSDWNEKFGLTASKEHLG